MGWRRVFGPFKEFGLAAGALYVVDRVLRSVSPRCGLYVYELVVQPLDGKPLLPARMTKNLRFGEIKRGDAELALMLAHDHIKAQRYDNGARCLGVWRRDKLLGYIWLSSGRYAEDEVRCDYELAAPGESVLDFDLYVLPEHRMGIGFMAVWHGASQYLNELGVRYTFSRMTRFNTASRRAHQRMGCRCAARALFLQLGQLELMAATTAPFVAATWSGRVNLLLRPDVLLRLPEAPSDGAARLPSHHQVGDSSRP
ncbi:MAG TPA: GNAT family N-acetyltransferase [Rubrivivax sp.]|nr:GNAT family N-acetyltransferase [Rubrivivax sp.]